MKNLEDNYPDNIVSLISAGSTLPELYKIIEEFLQTIPHMKTVITYDDKLLKPIPCYVIPSNDYVSKIIHKILYCSVPYTVMPILDTTYYYTWFENSKYCFTKLGIHAESYIAIPKEDYETYLLYD